MLVRFYRLLLRLYPARYRATFGREMTAVFEQAQADAWSRGALRGAAFCMREFAGLALAALRERVGHSGVPEQPAASLEPAFADVPTFYTCEDYSPRRSALLQGAVLSLATFGGVCLAINYGGWHPVLLVGSYGRNHSGLLEARGPAVAQTDLTTEVKVKAERASDPSDPWGDYASVYFRVIRVLRALDVDHDHVISGSEIANAPAVLLTLDRNHDGKLTPDECGQSFADDPKENAAIEATFDAQLLQRFHLGFMRLHPVLAALDADHDGEISTREMQNASAALKSLDSNGDGRLTPDELLPDPLANAVAHFMPLESHGKISKREWSSRLAKRYQGFFEEADQNHDGVVTEEDVRKEILRRADQNRDGILTQEELRNAFRSGAFEDHR
jgi:Ca2+-binding EF-hand superfamily protein